MHSTGEIAAADYDWTRRDPYPPDELLGRIDDLSRRWFYGENHPLGRRLLQGELTADQLSFLAVQEYAYYRETTWWNAGKLLNAGSLETQRLLHGALLDELGTDLVGPGLPAHAELFLRYCEGLGLKRSDVADAPLAPGVVLAITELRRIAREGDVLQMLVASNLVIERQRPRHYRALLETFRRHYPWVPAEALVFYEVHAEQDTDHESRGRRIVRAYLREKHQQDLAMSATLRSLGLRQVLYDAIHRAMCDARPMLIARWPRLPADPWPRAVDGLDP